MVRKLERGKQSTLRCTRLVGFLHYPLSALPLILGDEKLGCRSEPGSSLLVASSTVQLSTTLVTSVSFKAVDSSSVLVCPLYRPPDLSTSSRLLTQRGEALSLLTVTLSGSLDPSSLLAQFEAPSS